MSAVFSLSDFGVLLAPTSRSRAFLQMLAGRGIKPAEAILLPGVESEGGKEPIKVPLYSGGGAFTFRPAETLGHTLARLGVPFTLAPTSDMNAPEFIDFIKARPSRFFLYSGMPGCLLRTDIFRQSGKRFLHAHGGVAPRYSGSTAFYYSLLERGTIGATVFWMEEGLDTGDIIHVVEAPPHQGLDIDHVQDPVIRAEAMAAAIEILCRDSAHHEKQNHDTRVTYHIIHPVLKHLALKKTG